MAELAESSLYAGSSVLSLAAPKSVIDSEGKFLTVVMEGKVLQINARHPQYAAARAALAAQDWGRLFTIMTPVDAIHRRRWMGEGVSVVGDELTFRGEVIHDAIADAIFNLIDQDKDPLPIVKFLVRAYTLPTAYENYRGSDEEYQKAVATFAESRKGLFEFVAKRGLHFTDRGTILGYKSVRGKGTTKSEWDEETKTHIKRVVEPLSDWYSGKFRNYIGVPVEMDPKDCDPSRFYECSQGLQIGTWQYAAQFHARENHVILLCEFEPEHVVSVPNQDEHGKVRVFRYVPVEIYTQSEKNRRTDPLPGTVYLSQMFDRTGLYDILADDPDGPPATPTPVGTYVGDSDETEE
jgi:hypothetical protein